MSGYLGAFYDIAGGIVLAGLGWVLLCGAMVL